MFVALAGILAGAYLYKTGAFGSPGSGGGGAQAAKLQGPAFEIPRPENVLRIVLLGGEFACGGGFAAGESLQGQLQTLLARNTTNRKIEILAGNINITDAAAREKVIEAAVRAQPAVVLLVLEREPAMALANITKRNLAAGSPEFAAARDAFARKVGELILTKNDGSFSPSAPLPSVPDPSALAATFAQKNIKFTVVAVPSLLESDSELRALTLDYIQNERRQALNPGPDFSATSRRVAELRKAGLVALDLTPVFREGLDFRRMPLIDFESGRWNPVASNIAAAQITTNLISAGLLK